MQIVIAYVVAAAVFLSIDLVWLGIVARDFYRDQMAPIIAQDFNVGAAVAFYALYIAGMLYFAVLPAIRSGHWQDSLLPAAVLGLVAYGTYDLTNMAVLRHWPLKLALIDMAWGTVLTTVAASASAYVALRVG